MENSYLWGASDKKIQNVMLCIVEDHHLGDGQKRQKENGGGFRNATV